MCLVSSLLLAIKRNSRSPGGLGIQIEKRWWVQERKFISSLLTDTFSTFSLLPFRIALGTSLEVQWLRLCFPRQRV